MTCPECGSDDTRPQTRVVHGKNCPEEQCRECNHKWLVERAEMTGPDLARHHRLTLEEWEAAQDAAEAMEAALTRPKTKGVEYRSSLPAFRGTTAEEIVSRVAVGWRRQTALLSVACGVYRDKVRAGEAEMTRSQIERRGRAA